MSKGKLYERPPIEQSIELKEEKKEEEPKIEEEAEVEKEKDERVEEASSFELVEADDLAEFDKPAEVVETGEENLDLSKEEQRKLKAKRTEGGLNDFSNKSYPWAKR